MEIEFTFTFLFSGLFHFPSAWLVKSHFHKMTLLRLYICHKRGKEVGTERTRKWQYMKHLELEKPPITQE